MVPAPSLEVQAESAGACLYQVSVTVPPQRVNREIEEVLRAHGARVRLPGFRPGKVPLPVLRRVLGASVQEELKQHFLEHVVADAAHQAGLRPLRVLDLDPGALQLEEDRPASLSFQVEVEPRIELPPWEELSLEARDTGARPEQVEDLLQALAREHARFDPAPGRELDEQHLAECDIAFVRGEEAGPTAEGLRLGLASPLYGADPEAFAAALRGARAGEERTVTVQFLEGFARAEWIGSAGAARVKLRQVVRPRPASLEELAADLGQPDVAALRERMAEQVARDNELRERDRLVHELLELVGRMRPFELPRRLLEDEIEATLRGHAARLEERAGLAAEEARRKAEEARPQIEEDSKRRLRHFFLVRRVAEQEGIAVTQGDLERAFRALGQHHQVAPDAVQAYYAEQGLTGRLRGDLLDGKVRARLAQIALGRARGAAAPPEQA